MESVDEKAQHLEEKLEEKLQSVDLIDSEFFDKPDKTPETIVEKLKSMFPTKTAHLNTLLNLLKFCFAPAPKKSIFQQTETDLIEEMSNKGGFNIADIAKQQLEAVQSYELENILFARRVASIPAFIDFAFIYYVRHFDPNAPIYKLPKTSFKYELIINVLNPPKDRLLELFNTCMTDSFITELRLEQPPFLMRTELTHDEVREKLNNEVKPIFKEMLELLLKLDKPEKLEIETVKVESRPDNLDTELNIDNTNADHKSTTELNETNLNQTQPSTSTENVERTATIVSIEVE